MRERQQKSMLRTQNIPSSSEDAVEHIKATLSRALDCISLSTEKLQCNNRDFVSERQTKNSCHAISLHTYRCYKKSAKQKWATTCRPCSLQVGFQLRLLGLLSTSAKERQAQKYIGPYTGLVDSLQLPNGPRQIQRCSLLLLYTA